jgi:hypothetical protein
MISTGDKLMYEAKQAGGRRVCFARLDADELIKQSQQSDASKDAISIAEGKNKR